MKRICVFCGSSSRVAEPYRQAASRLGEGIGAAGMRLPQALAGRFTGMDLVEPEIDMVGLAKSFGVDAIRVTEPDQLSDSVKQSLAGDRPQLIDVPISRAVPGRLNYG